MELDRGSADLVALVCRVVAAHRATSERHHLRVETTGPDLVVQCDAVRLERVVDNLIANAVKYSPDGGDVVVEVMTADDEMGTWAVVKVRDHGVGIPAEDLPRVFERFHRARNIVGRIPGTGIGLASARAIAEQHGGGLTAESQEGAGSTFTLRLPRTPGAQSRGEATEHDERAAAARPSRTAESAPG